MLERHRATWLCHLGLTAFAAMAPRLSARTLQIAHNVLVLAGVSTPNLSMVVASCCRTGVIDQRGADGLVGLAQALIAAGAASAIAVLWAVDDAGTSLMMAKFYDQLAAVLPPPRRRATHNDAFVGPRWRNGNRSRAGGQRRLLSARATARRPASARGKHGSPRCRHAAMQASGRGRLGTASATRAVARANQLLVDVP